MADITYQVMQKPIEERIIDAACIYWDVEREYFFHKKGDTTKSYRRGVVYYIIKECTTYSYLAMAEMFGFIAHQPVLRLVDNIKSTKGIYKQTLNDINQIRHLADKLDAAFITTSIELITDNETKKMKTWQHIQRNNIKH